MQRLAIGNRLKLKNSRSRPWLSQKPSAFPGGALSGYKNGFTLIELMVVMLIIMIVLSISVVLFNTRRLQNRPEALLESLQSVSRMLQTQAILRHKLLCMHFNAQGYDIQQWTPTGTEGESPWQAIPHDRWSYSQAFAPPITALFSAQSEAIGTTDPDPATDTEASDPGVNPDHPDTQDTQNTVDGLPSPPAILIPSNCVLFFPNGDLSPGRLLLQGLNPPVEFKIEETGEWKKNE